jgi:F0F1-type ATP synthase assembly protein I
MDRERGKSQNPWRAIGMATAIGADLVICMGAGFGIGYLLKSWLGGHPIWLVLGIMLGFIAGVFGLIWLMRFYLEERNG